MEHTLIIHMQLLYAKRDMIWAQLSATVHMELGFLLCNTQVAIKYYFKIGNHIKIDSLTTHMLFDF